MAEYSRLASGQVTSTGGDTTIVLPFIPDFVEISNKNSAVNGRGVYRAWWNTDQGLGSAFLESVTTGSGGNYGYVYTLTQAGTVAIGGDVIWNNAIGQASGVSVAVGTGNITVANAGVYKIQFQLAGSEPNQFAITVNGVVQTNAIYASGAGTQQTTGEAILSLPAGAVVTIRNNLSTGAITLAPTVGGTANQAMASVAINQVGATGGDTVGYIDVIGGTSSAGLVNGTGFNVVKAGLSLQYGPTVLLGASGGITNNATAPVITTSAAHNLVVGNVVVFSNLYQTASTGMQQIAGIPFEVQTVPSATTFTINWNTNQANYTAIATGGLNTLASFKKVLYPALYAPGQAFISAITLGATTTIQTTAPSNVVVGQEVGFHIPTVWGPTGLNELPNVLIPGSPKYGYVVSVTNSTTFVVNIDSTLFSAYNSNKPFASFSGQQFPVVVPVGDVNTGGLQISVGSQLYPSPNVYNGFQGSITAPVGTINGPAINGSYINATFMGVIVGSGVSGALGDKLFYRAYMSDINR